MGDQTRWEERLEAMLAERGATLRTPAEHRDRWLEQLVRPGPSAFDRRDEEPGPADLLDSALDAAAVVLIELPRLQTDAWRGWADERLGPIRRLLEQCELPEQPPRPALAEVWAEVRARHPLELNWPVAGDAPESMGPVRERIAAYLGALEGEFEPTGGDGNDEDAAADTALAPTSSGGEPQTPPIPGRLLERRLRVSLQRHIRRCRTHLLPLAHEQYFELLPAQRAGLSLLRRRGEQARLEEGRGPKTRDRLPRNLAAWVLRKASLPRVSAGLFLHHVDPSCITTAIGPAAGEGWEQRLATEIDNAIAFWKHGAGAKGNPPSIHLDHLGSELRDLLCPAGP